ncbi:MAG: Hsp20/alpha crystallin family protein [Candidatus Moranbacteria bacterium]|nr:Hsp20/alpha crystallin family protein [Candidatus Moranbacteria bacterium]
MKREVMPFDPFRDLMKSWDEDFFGGDFAPSANVYQDKDNVIVEMDVPGVDPEKVDVSVENDVLTVSGSREDKREVKREDYYRKETRSGSFARSVILPMQVKSAKAEAEFNNGVLKITLPKAEETKAKKIKIKPKK